MSLLLMLWYLLLFALLVAAVENLTVLCGGYAICPEGCYHLVDPLIFKNESLICAQVGRGFYSPVANNSRYECPRGSFSNVANAESCVLCPKGTYSVSSAQTECQLCLPGYFAAEYGQWWCDPCNDAFYKEPGSDRYHTIDGVIYCDSSTRITTQSPSNVPTSAVTFSPSPSPSAGSSIEEEDNSKKDNSASSPSTMPYIQEEDNPKDDLEIPKKAISDATAIWLMTVSGVILTSFCCVLYFRLEYRPKQQGQQSDDEDNDELFEPSSVIQWPESFPSLSRLQR